MGEEHEDILKANIRKLSEISAAVEEVGVSERIFDRLNEQELAIHRITNQLRDFVTGRELKDVRRYLEDKIGKSTLTLENRIGEQEAAIMALNERLKNFATKEEVLSIRNSLEDTKAEISKKIEEISKKFSEDIKGLADVDSGILQDVERIKGLLEKLDEHSMSIQKLNDMCNAFITEKDLLKMREDIEREDLGEIKNAVSSLKSDFEKRMADFENSVRKDIRGLTEVDGKIIERLGKIEDALSKLNAHDVEIKKLSDVYSGFVDLKTLDSFRESLVNEEIKSLEASIGEKLNGLRAELNARIDELSSAISKIVESASQFVTRQELKESLEGRIGGLEKSFKESVKALSEVDAKIIDDLSKIDKIAEKIRSQDVAIRKLSEMYEGFVVEKDLRELQAALERKIEKLAERLGLAPEKVSEKAPGKAEEAEE